MLSVAGLYRGCGVQGDVSVRPLIELKLEERRLIRTRARPRTVLTAVA